MSHTILHLTIMSLLPDYLTYPSLPSFFLLQVIAKMAASFAVIGDREFTLAGDSMFVRLWSHLNLQKVNPNGPFLRRKGLCISGGTTSVLSAELNQSQSPVNENILLMIGTNDILKVRDHGLRFF